MIFQKPEIVQNKRLGLYVSYGIKDLYDAFRIFNMKKVSFWIKNDAYTV